MYDVYARMNSAKIVYVDHNGDFTLPVPALLETLRSRPRILALANPNGALGSYISPESLEQVIDVAACCDTLVIVDEAYVDYAPVSNIATFSAHPNVVSVRTFSKAGGLAGLRIGYAVSSSEIIGWLGQVRPNVEVNQIAVEAARYLLRRPDTVTDHVRETLAGKNMLTEWMTSAGFATYEGHANFIQVRFGAARQAILAALRTARVLVKDHPGGGILEPWTRITVGPPEQMKLVTDIIEKVISHDRPPSETGY
jgi:histidinol-phosphate aminotransferase